MADSPQSGTSARIAAAGHARVRLVRHAQASFGAADYDCLSALGERQAQHLAAWLAAQPQRYARIVRGGMRRHAQTLAAIERAFAAGGVALPRVDVDADWNEVDHEAIARAYAQAHPDDADIAAVRAGDARALRALWMTALKAWRDGAIAAGSETFAEFRARVTAARTRLEDGDGPVLVVTSGGTMWMCVQSALDLDDDALAALNLKLRNTGISDFERAAPRWRMLSWDEVPHLDAPEHESLHTHF